MSHGTGRGGCYDITLEYADQSPASMGWARLWENENGVSTIKINKWQGLHESSIGTDEHWNLKPYYEDLRDYMDPELVPSPQAFSVVLTYPLSSNINPITLNILQVVVGSVSAKLVVETMDGNSPNFPNLQSIPTQICLPHPDGEESEDGDTGGLLGSGAGDLESDEDRAGDGNVPGVTLEYTTGIKVLEDVMPEPPLVYDGNDLIITLDLKNIIYKPSALSEIMNTDFKSY